jgi:hypothetical protein
VHYNSAPANFLPPDSPFWLPGFNADGARLINFANPAFQDKAAALCAALVRTKVYDGCMLDGWHDDVQTADRLPLIRKIREAAGERAIIMGNVNQLIPAHNGAIPEWHVHGGLR